MHIGAVTVLGTLGEGAHSAILHVRRADDGREYALKLVDLETANDRKFLEQTEREFRIAQMLDHPNLVKVFAFETEKNWRLRVKKARLLIELVKGTTLDDAALPLGAKLFRCFEKVAAGVAYMHHRGVFHADLKPNNVMVGRGGLVKVLDYGLAWIKGEPKNRVQGTPEYLAPETAEHKIVDERSDIFNFGATMYRLATGEYPPSVLPELGVAMTGKAYKGLYRPVAEVVPKAPPALAKLIDRCLGFDPKNRPAGMAEVQGALDRIADDAEEAES